MRTVDPTMAPSLNSFGCGGTTAPEVEVNELVAGLHAGHYPQLSVRIAEDPADGSLIGLCAVQPRALGQHLDAAYVGLIGVHQSFRGKRDHNGSTFGDVLLVDALRLLHETWGAPPMPPVWAMVAPSNVASHSLFDRHGFAKIDRATGGYDIRYLPREMP
jgi:ribosomal protein S18 acetylase RimI-like enzyme